MLLVDASIWIFSERFKVPVASLLPENEAIATCPMIVQEVLRGTHNASHYQFTRNLLLETEILDADTPFKRFEEAARCFSFAAMPASRPARAWTASLRQLRLRTRSRYFTMTGTLSTSSVYFR